MTSPRSTAYEELSDARRAELRAQAEAILRANDRGGYTIPSGTLYPHQWAWDSAFIAIGWAHLHTGRAVQELEELMSGQWDDGRVPHIRFRTDDPGYRPGPQHWRCEHSSSITNPPIWAMALERILALGGPRDRIAALLPAVERSHRFFREQRDPLGIGCVCVAHPWESGLDNSPAWDAALSRVPDDEPIGFDRVDVLKVDDPSERPTDADYRRYMFIVRSIADASYGLGAFAVYDPMMTALLIKAEHALARLGEALGVATDARERVAPLSKGLREHMWSERDGRYGLLDATTETLTTPDLLLCHVPVTLVHEPEERRAAMCRALDERYQTTAPLPSTPPCSPAFDGRRYWRGPSWINVNWLFRDARPWVRPATLALVDRQGFREYFDPQTGDGLGSRAFSWTAALALDLLSDR
jgi:glycogen debranching enzyme